MSPTLIWSTNRFKWKFCCRLYTSKVRLGTNKRLFMEMNGSKNFSSKKLTQESWSTGQETWKISLRILWVRYKFLISKKVIGTLGPMLSGFESSNNATLLIQYFLCFIFRLFQNVFHYVNSQVPDRTYTSMDHVFRLSKPRTGRYRKTVWLYTLWF